MPDYSGNVSEMRSRFALFCLEEQTQRPLHLSKLFFFSLSLPFFRNVIKQDLCAACKYSAQWLFICLICKLNCNWGQIVELLGMGTVIIRRVPSCGEPFERGAASPPGPQTGPAQWDGGWLRLDQMCVCLHSRQRKPPNEGKWIMVLLEDWMSFRLVARRWRWRRGVIREGPASVHAPPHAHTHANAHKSSHGCIANTSGRRLSGRSTANQA